MRHSAGVTEHDVPQRSTDSECAWSPNQLSILLEAVGNASLPVLDPGAVQNHSICDPRNRSNRCGVFSLCRCGTLPKDSPPTFLRWIVPVERRLSSTKESREAMHGKNQLYLISAGISPIVHDASLYSLGPINCNILTERRNCSSSHFAPTQEP